MSDQHLVPTITNRGFKHMPDIVSKQGEVARVYESSNAEGPHVWVFVDRGTGEEGTGGFAHLTAEQAQQYGEQILWLVRNHYQGYEETLDVELGKRMQEISDRAYGATEGPWQVTTHQESLTRVVVNETGTLHDISFGYVGNSNTQDAEFVAAAREDVPWLLEQLHDSELFRKHQFKTALKRGMRLERVRSLARHLSSSDSPAYKRIAAELEAILEDREGLDEGQ